MAAIASKVKRGRSLTCSNGSHIAMYDESEAHFAGLIRFIQDVDQTKF
jgi:hypothetical protein